MAVALRDLTHHHWSLAIASIVYIVAGLILSLFGKSLAKLTVSIAGGIFGWLVFSEVGTEGALKVGSTSPEKADNIGFICGIIGAILLAMIACRALKAGIVIIGMLFGVLLASTINTGFLRHLVSSITSAKSMAPIA